MNDGAEVRILLADGHSLFREALSTALTAEPDLVVVGEARDGLEAVAEAARTEPQVAVLEADLPSCDGLRAAALIRGRLPDCLIVPLAADEEPDILASAIEAGASGYLTKASALTDLVDATRSVHRGDTLVPSRMLGSLLERLIRRRQQHDEALRRLSRLTSREREVLTLLAKGGDNDSIAQVLVISPQTARTHHPECPGEAGGALPAGGRRPGHPERAPGQGGRPGARDPLVGRLLLTGSPAGRLLLLRAIGGPQHVQGLHDPGRAGSVRPGGNGPGRGVDRRGGGDTPVLRPPVHRIVAYRAAANGARLPFTDDAAGRVLILPLWEGMTSEQVGQVGEAIERIRRFA